MNFRVEDYLANIKKAEKAINYEFKNKDYLLQALTHPSASSKYSYERLEFLGDSILGTSVSFAAYNKYKDMNEGQLTHVKVALVSGDNLSRVASNLGLAECIIFGQSEKSTGQRGLKSALENVFEAIVAAIYLDGGATPVDEFLEEHILSSMKPDGRLAIKENPKSALQEKLQAKKLQPQYSIIDEYGPAHDKRFVAVVSDGNNVLAKGRGKTKKEAEADAAETALSKI